MKDKIKELILRLHDCDGMCNGCNPDIKKICKDYKQINSKALDKIPSVIDNEESKEDSYTISQCDRCDSWSRDDLIECPQCAKESD